MARSQAFRSQNDFHHGVCGQGAVQLIELLATGRCDGDRHAQVVAAFAFAQLERGRGVKCRIELLGNMGDGVYESIDARTHDFDGESAWVLDQRLFARVVLWGNGGCHGLNYPLCDVLSFHLCVITYNERLCRTEWM